VGENTTYTPQVSDGDNDTLHLVLPSTSVSGTQSWMSLSADSLSVNLNVPYSISDSSFTFDLEVNDGVYYDKQSVTIKV
jgi:hypothetical protein